ncbi:MAG: T9SS type A sorting domain-containing protein [Flavobacteriales bacterium]|nr:T9SS type A sorting domain-containing protein [Flavobacteriales bacterium]
MVTFQVDMSQMVISPQGVHLAGDFQAWDPAATLMTDIGGGVYSITLDLPPGVYEYKFINGDTWGTDEIVPIACGIDDGMGNINRFVTISADVVLPAVCFGQCNVCQPASFVMNGNATSLGSNCYNVTPGLQWQNGAIWSNTQIDLNMDFSLQFVINLGTNDAGGADGIVFVLQRLGSAVIGANGGGMGYSSFGTSLGVEFDTFYNAGYNDPTYDHIAIEINGQVNHAFPECIGAPVQMSPTNANTEDGLPHIVTINWDSTTQTLRVYFDCTLRAQATYDLVNNVFGGEPLVFWGFTGATGEMFNQQRICAVPNAMITDQVDICPGASTMLSAGTSVNGIYNWTPATYLNNPNIASPIASPPTTTVYTVSYLDLCFTTVTQQVTVNVLTSGPACFFLPVSLANFEVKTFHDELFFEWSTYSEWQNDFFTIEESIDGYSFQAILEVPGHFTTNEHHEYRAEHTRRREDAYYRLLQTDINGQSRIIGQTHFVKGFSDDYIIQYFKQQNLLQVMGNLEDAPYVVEIFDVSGRLVDQRSIVSQSGYVQLFGLELNGIYMLVLKKMDGTSLYNGKVVISK